ncbi:MAG: transcriptional repressor [Pseudomonadota bacterium]|nr:transcriptional repressor [Pseudomonadota bacterium]
MDVQAVEQVLRKQGCALTPQRRAVLRFLDGNLEHPSAGQVFDAVTAALPSTSRPVSSRATIYNTLALLEQIGAVRVLRGTDGEMRYDPNTTPHHHRCCDVCGRLEDVPAEAVTLLLDGRPAVGEVRFTGRCPACTTA